MVTEVVKDDGRPYRRYETRTIRKELSPEVIDGVRLIISFFTSPPHRVAGPKGRACNERREPERAERPNQGTAGRADEEKATRSEPQPPVPTVRLTPLSRLTRRVRLTIGPNDTKRESNGVRRGPRDSILFTLNLFIPHAFVIFILFVFHLLRLVQGKLYRYSPRLIENLPKAGINLGFSFFICRTFIIGGFY